MAKNPTSKDDPKGPGAAVAEADDPGIELPVLDQEDEALLTRAAEREERPEPGEEDTEPAKPKAEAKPKDKTEPTKEEPLKAEAEPAPEKVKLSPIERAERTKRQEYARKWQSALEEQERLQARIAQLQREVKVGEVKSSPERVAAIKARLKLAL